MNCKSGIYDIVSGKCIGLNKEYRTVSDLAKDAGDSLVNKGVQCKVEEFNPRLNSKPSIKIGMGMGIKKKVFYIGILFCIGILFFTLRNRIL